MIALAFWTQTAVDGLTLPSAVWRALAVVGWTGLIGIIGFLGRGIIKRLDKFAEDRDRVMERVEEVAAKRVTDMAEIWGKLYGWNESATKAIAENTSAVHDFREQLVQFEQRLPQPRKRKASQ